MEHLNHLLTIIISFFITSALYLCATCTSINILSPFSFQRLFKQNLPKDSNIMLNVYWTSLSYQSSLLFIVHRHIFAFGL